ncbi:MULTISPECIES: TetR/AcrR family transcriptional regulator [unclassified Vibrio]|uniref:TetR/AcrR family transcriptional regulator n=1 Tax=Vibrio sp. HB236076 TaxID=3232307 RepID=A0AB39HEP5_9VIBR|nr:TetR/AcrR family transcriptional regulator [Vibrio sp. HB161653]MDP5254379.1 TetR/AcrR family transcriptional regulator [Vibrio sp. HB161653]
MAEPPRRAGRPQQPTQARETLIHQARALFVSKPYAQVSLRMVAKNAGVNSALIHYYFTDKAGLFEAVIRETIAPMLSNIERLLAQQSPDSFYQLMEIYYQEMGKVPDFPRLIFQTLYGANHETPRQLLDGIFGDITSLIERLFAHIADNHLLQPDIDSRLARISYLSLMVFPFLAPPAFYQMHHIELSEDFLKRLYQHNLHVIRHGFLQTESKCQE